MDPEAIKLLRKNLLILIIQKFLFIYYPSLNYVLYFTSGYNSLLKHIETLASVT